MSNGGLRVRVADDELVARKRLVRLLEALPDVDVVGVHENAESVLEAVRDGATDVLVLDIQMPGLSGLEAHALMGDDSPYVIFATAHPQHAVEAFDLGAVDYVLKPIEAGRLAKALERARKHRRGQLIPPTAVKPGAFDRIAVQTRKGIVLLDPSAVSHALFDGSLVTIYTTAGDEHLADGTLQDLLSRLDSNDFERVHRRALLNLREVGVLRPTDSGGFVAQTKSGHDVPVSRQSARRLRKWLGLSKG